MSIVYRDTHDIDLDQLAALLRKADMSEGIAAQIKLAQQVRGVMFVVSAWDGETLVGFAQAFSDGVKNAYVSTVAILPEYRRRGIGRELMRRLLDGRDSIAFELNARTEVKPFYLSCGFTEGPLRFRRERKS